MSKTICLVSLPSPFLIDEKVFPPLGILYLVTALNHHGIKSYVHDTNIEEIPRGFSFYGISATTPQFPLALAALKHIRKIEPKAKVIIGGPHATVDPGSCGNFDSVVIGNGENVLPLALDFDAEFTGDLPVPQYLPDRSAIDIKKYSYTIDDLPATSIMTSRGCPFSCGFCCKSAGKIVLNSAADVIRELLVLKYVYGYNAFMFFDDIFIADPIRFAKIAAFLKEEKIKWRGFTRADLLLKLGDELVEKMAQSGCVEIGMGIESGSDKILSLINKGENTDTIKAAVKMLHRHEIRVKGFFIVGLPSESRETISETASLVSELNLDDIDFTIFQPFKGSYIYEHKNKFDIDWNELDLTNMFYKGKIGLYQSMVWTSSLTKQEIVEARDYLERRFKK